VTKVSGNEGTMRMRAAPRPVRLCGPGLALLFLLFGASLAGTRDYAALFGPKFGLAESLVARDGWLERDLGLGAEESAIARAVVFPEVLRYSVLADAIQVRALKVLYVQYGRGFLNFSVGIFQMKPAFVESLESDWMTLFTDRERLDAGGPAFDRSDTRDQRRRRVARLDDPAWQAVYLRLFMRVMDRMYGGTAFAGPDERVRFYATAYNLGYRAGEKAIRGAMADERFHTALLFPRKRYCYADIAAYYYARSEG
jgi:hypothetical protein